MTLSPGTRLGPYEIQTAIGAGGMGEVYKAKDTRLDRTVAIKVLPAGAAADPEVRRRFEQEARAASALNHPHICVLYDIGSQEGTDYLVMEHLEGETLAKRLAKGPLPLEQALQVGIEIADALAVAHKQGIIHRDLKPGNVMLTKAGAKLLDFGLAKLRAPGATLGGDFSSLPTHAVPETEKGMILGTLAYMAPEQLEGKEADAHSDLFSLGAVLYEMLTGARAFTGTSPASVISAVMSAQPPPVSSLQPLTPPVIDRLVRQCLAKTPEDRPDTAHDVANDLRWVLESRAVGTLVSAEVRHRRTLRSALLAAAVPIAAGIGAGLMWTLRPASPPMSTLRVAVPVTPAEELTAGGADPVFLRTPGGSRTALAWTPDGEALVFVGRRAGVQQLYVRRLDAAEARALEHTEGAQWPTVSPDGQWVAFWAGGAIKKVRLSGGPAVDVMSGNPYLWGLNWDAHGGLVCARPDGRIWTIPLEGEPSAVTPVDEVGTDTLPSVLPGGRVLLYSVKKRGWSWGDEPVVALTLATGERKVVLTDATDARYVPATGHLVFLRRGVLYAVSFDAERLQRRGPEVPVLDGVAQALTAIHAFDVTGAGQFAIAPTGTLAWIGSPVVPPVQGRLVTVDRRGQVTALPSSVASYAPAVRLSPDHRRLAVQVRTLTEVGLWVYDLERPAPLLRLPMNGEAAFPVWKRGGQELVFAWLKEDGWSLASLPADGTGSPRVLAPGFVVPSSLTPEGGRLAAVQDLTDLAMVTLEDGKVRVEPMTQTADTEAWPGFSPDGRWLVYGSNGTGRFEVYVRPFPGPGGALPVSAEGGSDPAWHPSGREIFFVTLSDATGERRMMAVPFTPGSPPGRPRELFRFNERDLDMTGSPVRGYDVAADGQRFYTVQRVPPPPATSVTHINLIMNWLEELKAKAPTGR